MLRNLLITRAITSGPIPVMPLGLRAPACTRGVGRGVLRSNVIIGAGSEFS
jgi:hypothetical protein